MHKLTGSQGFTTARDPGDPGDPGDAGLGHSTGPFFHGIFRNHPAALGYPHPRCSMYGIFTYIWVIFGVNVGKYSIHGAYGHDLVNIKWQFEKFGGRFSQPRWPRNVLLGAQKDFEPQGRWHGQNLQKRNNYLVLQWPFQAPIQGHLTPKKVT